MMEVLILKNKKWLFLLIPICILLILVIISTAMGIGNNSKKEENSIDTYKVKNDDPIEATGKATPEFSKNYKKESIGSFNNVRVKNGEKVNSGDELISYDINYNDRAEIVNNINEVKKSIDNDYANINEKPNNNELNNQLNKDLNSLSSLQSKLNKYDSKIISSTRASFDGIVDVQNSENVQGDERILKLLSDHSIVKTKVNELDIDKIKEGQEVNIKVNKSDKKTKGKITYIAQSPISSSNSEGGDNELSEYQITVGDIESPIRDGSSVQISIPSKTIKIPKKFLTKDNKVFTIDKNKKVHKKDITIQKNNGDIFVKKGLNVGETIVEDQNFNEGEKIEVSK